MQVHGHSEPVSVAAMQLAEEELARRNWYLMLARLFRAPPDAGVLAAISDLASPSAPGDAAAPLERAFAELADACRHASVDSVRQEYDTVFLGVGKAEIFLYASWHLTGFLNDRMLVELRDRMAEFGLQRRQDIGETEDHLSALCETMALLIESADPGLSSIDTQRAFFMQYLKPWFKGLCDAIEHSGLTDFYKHAGRAARVFLDVERQAFEFDEKE
ncbi:MAG TPA: molecular chaperone TorD family protein [Burkholderiaceae bacterium]|nr:molecular chaperone TorD family protein [Burkholderiaceae bacterium]